MQFRVDQTISRAGTKRIKKISTHLLIPGTDGGMVWTLFSLFFVLCPNSQLQSAKKGSDRPPPLLYKKNA